MLDANQEEASSMSADHSNELAARMKGGFQTIDRIGQLQV